MPVAASSPGTLGLYINSFTMSSSSVDPYKELLGADGYGNYSGGNKLTDLFNYTNQYGYNYAIFYDLSKAVSVGGGFVTRYDDEVFLTTANRGVNLLNAIMPLAHAAGLTDRGAVCDVNFHQMSSVGVFSPWEGIAQTKKIVDYNQSVSYDPTKAFTKIVTETEFWNFHYKEVTPGDGGSVPMAGTVRTLNSTSGGYSRGEIRSNTIPTFNGLGINVNDLIEIDNEWRQVVSVSASIIYVDRPWTVPTVNQPWSHYTYDETVDYETYLYRVGKMADYIATYGSGEEIELYVANPSFTFKGSRPAGVPDQLKRLYQAGVSKILLTAYQRIPSFDSGNSGASMDNNYGSSPSGGYRKISDDIAAEGVPRDVGVIISVESATFNNANGCPNGVNTDNNFSGYIMEGRSLLPHSTSTDFKGVDPGGLTTACVCCPAGLVRPDISYNPLSLDEIWQYVAETPPSGGVCPACYAPTLAATFNEVIALGGTRGTNLDNNITFDTLIVFDQEFMRQLDITPAIALDSSISGTDSTCNGVDDGTATVGVTGGVSPYTYQWEVFSGGFWINYVGTGATTNTITGLVPGIYRCEVTDAAATVATSNSEIVSEPAVIDFTVVSTTANCAGTGGSISITGVTGGTTPYLYSIVPTGDPKIWTGVPSRNGLIAGTYDVSVASGDPADGCFVTKTGTITTGSSFTITATQGNAGCYLGTGSLTTTPSVAGTYTYDLYDSSPALIQSNSSGVFNNLVAGAYTIQATNSLGCSSNILSKTITQPTAVTVSTVEIIAPDCYGNANGSIEVSASGGTGPYSYTIIYPTTNVVSNSSGIFVNLPSGQYTVYAEDAQGCTSNLVFLTVPVTAQIQADYQVTQPRTGESTTGSIILESISGGSEPIEYLWSNAATSSSLSDVPTGDYTVIITDNNGCNITKTFTIRLECPTFTLEEMKILAYKAQCCAGDLAVKYINNIREGREDLAKCKLDDLRALTMIIDTLYCTQDPGAEACLSCEDMQNLMTQINNLCDCDCCKDPNYQTIDVTYDSSTGSINQI